MPEKGATSSQPSTTIEVGNPNKECARMSGTSHQVDAIPANYEFSVSIGGVTIIRAESIRVDDATNLKYLRLKNGDFLLPKAVFLTFPDGTEIEITVDVPPEEKNDF